ncbi:hypothetical protein Btru_003918 [Bulinus truncatus]|nr:hypothetical protein Btru_003918 [Bulinus truncatus]
MEEQTKTTIQPQIIDGFKIEIDSDEVMCTEYMMDIKHDDRFFTSKLNTDKFVVDLNESVKPINMDRIPTAMYAKADKMATNGTTLCNLLNDNHHTPNNFCRRSGAKQMTQSTFSMDAFNPTFMKPYQKDPYIMPINCEVWHERLNHVPEYCLATQVAPLDLSMPKSRDSIASLTAAHRASPTKISPVSHHGPSADIKVSRPSNLWMSDDKEIFKSDSNESQIQIWNPTNLTNSANVLNKLERHVVHRPTPVYPKLFHSYCLYNGRALSNDADNSKMYTVTKLWGCCGKHLWAKPSRDSRFTTCEWKKIKVNLSVDPANQQSTSTPSHKDRLTCSDNSRHLTPSRSYSQTLPDWPNYPLPSSTEPKSFQGSDRDYHQMIDPAAESFQPDTEDVQRIQQYYSLAQSLASCTGLKPDSPTQEHVNTIHTSVPIIKHNRNVPEPMSSSHCVTAHVPNNLKEDGQRNDRNRRKPQKSRSGVIDAFVPSDEKEKVLINDQPVTPVYPKDLVQSSDILDREHEYLTSVPPKQKRRRTANTTRDVPLMETKNQPLRESLNKKLSSDKQETLQQLHQDKLFMGKNTKDKFIDGQHSKNQLNNHKSSRRTEKLKSKNVKLASYMCATCKLNFASLYALLVHQSKECYVGKPYHAIDCLGKYGENECQCTYCHFCLSIFNSKFRVFSHSQGRCFVRNTYLTSIKEGQMMQDNTIDQLSHPGYGKDEIVTSVSAGRKPYMDHTELRTALQKIKIKHHEDNNSKPSESLSEIVPALHQPSESLSEIVPALHQPSESLSEIVPASNQPSESCNEKAHATTLPSKQNKTEFKSPRQESFEKIMCHKYNGQVTNSGEVSDGFTSSEGIPVCGEINAEPAVENNFASNINSLNNDKPCNQIKSLFHYSNINAEPKQCPGHETPVKQSTCETSKVELINTAVLMKCRKNQSLHSQIDEHVTDLVNEQKPDIKMEVGDGNGEVIENPAQTSHKYSVPQLEVRNKSTQYSDNAPETNTSSHNECVQREITNINTGTFKVPTQTNIFSKKKSVTQQGVINKTTANCTRNALPVKQEPNYLQTSTIIKTEPVSINVSELKTNDSENDCPLELTCFSFHNHDDPYDNNHVPEVDVVSDITDGKEGHPNDSASDIIEDISFLQHDQELQHRSSKTSHGKYRSGKVKSLYESNVSPVKKSAIAFGACQKINKNGEKEKITYLLDANSTPIIVNSIFLFFFRLYS